MPDLEMFDIDLTKAGQIEFLKAVHVIANLAMHKRKGQDKKPGFVIKTDGKYAMQYSGPLKGRRYCVVSIVFDRLRASTALNALKKIQDAYVKVLTDSKFEVTSTIKNGEQLSIFVWISEGE